MAKKKKEIKYIIGLELGAVLAAIISWNAWHAIGWAMLHAIFGWI